MGVRCKCGILAPCREAWKSETLDPRRRFYGCSRYNDPRLGCNFFKWAEPSYTERSREVINDLKMKIDKKCDELISLSDGLNIADKKIMMLKEELSLAEKKNKDLMDELTKLESSLSGKKNKELMVFIFLGLFLIGFVFVTNQFIWV